MAQLREITAAKAPSAVRYSVCTMMTKPDEYSALQKSFQDAGFEDDFCEFLYIDNSLTNQCEAFHAINRFLQEATGDYIILCHQDVRLHDHNLHDLDRVIADISAGDPTWAVLGNAGGVAPGHLAIRITDAKGVDTKCGPFPSRVAAMDENFIIVKRSANLSLSADLKGFHFYGTDLCIVAEILGYNCYVIDFHLHHIGGENLNKGKATNSFHTSYPKIRQALIDKYLRAFRPRWIQNNGTILHLSGSRWRQSLMNGKVGVGLCKVVGKLRRKLRGVRRRLSERRLTAPDKPVT